MFRKRPPHRCTKPLILFLAVAATGVTAACDEHVTLPTYATVAEFEASPAVTPMSDVVYWINDEATFYQNGIQYRFIRFWNGDVLSEVRVLENGVERFRFRPEFAGDDISSYRLRFAGDGHEARFASGGEYLWSSYESLHPNRADCVGSMSDNCNEHAEDFHFHGRNTALFLGAFAVSKLVPGFQLLSVPAAFSTAVSGSFTAVAGVRWGACRMFGGGGIHRPPVQIESTADSPNPAQLGACLTSIPSTDGWERDRWGVVSLEGLP